MWIALAKAGSWLLKNPVYIAVVVLAIACGSLWISNQFQDAKIAKQGAEITQLQALADRVGNNLEVCESNEMTLQEALNTSNERVQAAHDKSAILGEQVIIEQARVKEWMDKYANKVCLNNTDEVVIPKDRIIYATPIEYLPVDGEDDTPTDESVEPKVVVPTKNKVVTNEKSDEVVDSFNSIFNIND